MKHGATAAGVKIHLNISSIEAGKGVFGAGLGRFLLLGVRNTEPELARASTTEVKLIAMSRR